MPKPPTDTLPAGRELDALVAKKVLGLTVTHAYGVPWLGGRIPGPIPDYSTSWDAMRLVVERLVELHWEVNTLSAYGCLPECYLVPDSENHYCGTLSEHGDTLPHAVALAALKAVEANHG